MKKTLILATLMASALIAHAETVRVRIAAPLTATGVSIPAGEYTISTMPGNSSVLVIKSGEKTAFVFGKLMTSVTSGKTTVELTNAVIAASKTPLLAAMK